MKVHLDSFEIKPLDTISIVLFSHQLLLYISQFMWWKFLMAQPKNEKTDAVSISFPLKQIST